jgi:hypothetical protein
VRKWDLKETLKEFEIPGSTLKDNVNNKKIYIEKPINTLLGRKPALSYDLKE